jgi:tripartite-type tricarboxylate transporter receptor subunit TctC
MGAASALPLFSIASHAQSWPQRPIRLIVGYPAGGQTDLFARTYGEYITQQTGQQVLVDNRAGAGGSLAAAELKRAEPDGHSFMFTISTTVIMNRVLYKSLPYDFDKDFRLVTVMPSGSLPTLAATRTGASNLQQFIAHARRTEKVNIGTYSAGSYAHMVVAELNKEFDLKMEAVHYKGEAPMWTDVGGGITDAGTGSFGAALPMLQSGKARAIGVSRKRIRQLPDVATFQEQGVQSKAFQLTGFQSCVAHIGTPMPIVRRMSELLVTGSQTPKIQQLMANLGVDEPAMSYDATQKLYQDEAPLWIDLVKGLGLTPM